MPFLDTILNKLIKSEFVKARVLAAVRHGATALGVWLVSKGLADNSMSADIVGFAVAAASFYLADLDVKVVDGKIKVAFLTEPSVKLDSTPSGKLTPEQEQEVTKQLNTLSRNVGKAGW